MKIFEYMLNGNTASHLSLSYYVIHQSLTLKDSIVMTPRQETDGDGGSQLQERTINCLNL